MAIGLLFWRGLVMIVVASWLHITCDYVAVKKYTLAATWQDVPSVIVAHTSAAIL